MKPTAASRLKVRPILELIGLIVLIISLYQGRKVIGDALDVIKMASLVPIILCFSLAWLNFLWSGIGYRLLLVKPLPLLHISLTHLAAAGPGRVIPGGAGFISFGTLFLRKNGLTLPQSVAVSVANNAIGFAVNITLLAALYLLRPSLLGKLHVSPTVLLAFLGVATLLVVLYLYLRKRFANVGKKSRAYTKDLKKLIAMLRAKPLRAVLLIAVMLTIIATNSTILFVAAYAVHMNLAFTTGFIAMSSGVALGSLLPTPGGIGGVEAGIIASLYALGYPLELSTSTALLFRAATYLQPIIPGTIAYIWLRKKDLL